MSMTSIELAEERFGDRRRARTCGGCPERGTSWCAACRAEMDGAGADGEEGGDGDREAQ